MNPEKPLILLRSPINRIDILQRFSEFSNFHLTELRVNSLRGSRLMAETYTGSMGSDRSYWSWDKTTSTVWTNVVQDSRHTVTTERALIGADKSLR